MQRIAKWLLVCALIVSIGGHWAILQSVAWVTMTVDFSKNAPLSVALEKTFDGKHLCRLCKFVREGSASEKEQQAKVELKKVDGFPATEFVFFFPELKHPRFEQVTTPNSHVDPPLLLPPRILPG